MIVHKLNDTISNDNYKMCMKASFVTVASSIWVTKLRDFGSQRNRKGRPGENGTTFCSLHFIVS